MIIYTSDDCECSRGYKTDPIIGFDFIQSRSVAARRPIRPLLRELTIENRKFIENLELKLKKQVKSC